MAMAAHRRLAQLVSHVTWPTSKSIAARARLKVSSKTKDREREKERDNINKTHICHIPLRFLLTSSLLSFFHSHQHQSRHILTLSTSLFSQLRQRSFVQSHLHVHTHTDTHSWSPSPSLSRLFSCCPSCPRAVSAISADTQLPLNPVT